MNELLSDLYKNAEGFIVYTKLDAPAFDPGDNMTTEKAFEKIRDSLKEIHKRETNVVTLTWLRLCSLEVDKAETKFATGENRDGRMMLGNAAGYLRDAMSRRSMKPTFIAGDENFGVREVKN